jgi:hypothetical protein
VIGTRHEVRADVGNEPLGARESGFRSTAVEDLPVADDNDLRRLDADVLTMNPALSGANVPAGQNSTSRLTSSGACTASSAASQPP